LRFSQHLLNSPDASSAPANPILLNARVMWSEERGAIYSETLVLWQELQVRNPTERLHHLSRQCIATHINLVSVFTVGITHVLHRRPID
jgi:hypothetical protein